MGRERKSVTGEEAQAPEWWSWQRSPRPSKPGTDAKTRTHTSQAPPPQLQKHQPLTCRPWPPRLGLVRACRGEMPPMPEGLRRPILPGGRARGGIGNCRWVRRATPIPTEPAMGSELEPNAQLRESRRQGVSVGRQGLCMCLPLPYHPPQSQWIGHNTDLL